MQGRVRTLLAVAVALSAVGALAWQSASRSSAIAKRDRDLASARQRIAELEQQLASAEQRFVAQRELLRDETLKSTVRMPDEFLALFPAPFPSGDWRPATDVFEDCWFRSDDGLRLHGWYLRRAQPRAAVLMLHGNAGNLTHRARVAQHWSERCNISFLLFDYRGYGRSEGTPTIPGLLRDARAGRRELARREAIGEAQVVLLGESLGGAVAVDLASADGARGLVLQSTFSSLREVARAHYPPLLVDVLVANQLNAAEAIQRYRGPLLQCHGESDRTVPIELGRKLFEAAAGPKQFIALPRHNHNDELPEAYDAALDRFVRSLP